MLYGEEFRLCWLLEEVELVDDVLKVVLCVVLEIIIWFFVNVFCVVDLIWIFGIKMRVVWLYWIFYWMFVL